MPGLAVLAALLFWLWGGRYVSTENAYVKAHIAQISAEVAGRILEVHVHDHAEVKAGECCFTIDPEPFRVALAKAEAELDATRSQVRTLIATWHEATERAAGGREQGRLLEHAAGTPEDAGRARHRLLQQVRGGREQRHGRRRSRGGRAQEGRARRRPARSATRTRPGRRAPDGAREAGRARARRSSTWPAP